MSFADSFPLWIQRLKWTQGCVIELFAPQRTSVVSVFRALGDFSFVIIGMRSPRSPHCPFGTCSVFSAAVPVSNVCHTGLLSSLRGRPRYRRAAERNELLASSISPIVSLSSGSLIPSLILIVSSLPLNVCLICSSFTHAEGSDVLPSPRSPGR